MNLLKTYFSFLFVFLSFSVFAGNGNNPLFKELIQTLNNRPVYLKEKEQKIENIKKIITPGTPLSQEYQINNRLREEYWAFHSDSAIHYVKRNLEIAELLNDKEKIIESKIYLSSLFLMINLFIDSELLLEGIRSADLPRNLQALYFDNRLVYRRTYEVNAKRSVQNEVYLYRDSILNVLEPGTFLYRTIKASQDVYLDNLELAEKELFALLEEEPGYTHSYAKVAHSLAAIFHQRGDKEGAKKYYTLSAIADMQNAVKENASLRMLALIYYDEGNIEFAYRLTQAAIEDAVFGNMQFRTMQISEFYSIVNGAYLQWERERREQLKFYFLLISLLSVFLVLTIAYIYKQMRRLSSVKEELSNTNEKLLKLNEDISYTNKQLKENNALLSESNHVKEEYIAHFFDLCSAYINRLEDYRRKLHKKAATNQLDDLFQTLKSKTIVEDELEELYKNFDHIFLNLYPTFVEDFNKLLIPEEQILLKPGELLNTELRIFALIRLGITDSVKIAAFLRYSLSTIYNYRTKARNKAAVSRDEFENRVMRIGLITEND